MSLFRSDGAKKTISRSFARSNDSTKGLKPSTYSKPVASLDLRCCRLRASLMASLFVLLIMGTQVMYSVERLAASPRCPSRFQTQDVVVGPLGIEPRTDGLKVRCSTAELRAHPIIAGPLLSFA